VSELGTGADFKKNQNGILFVTLFIQLMNKTIQQLVDIFVFEI